MDIINLKFVEFENLKEQKPKFLPKRNSKDVKLELDEISTFLVERLGNILPLENAFFAGGCIRDLMLNIEPRDYDIYFYYPEDTNKIKSYFATNQNNVIQSFLDNWNLTLEYKGKPVVFQFITLMSGTPDNIVNRFDFTMNMNYYVFSTEEIRIHPDVGDLRLHPGSNICRPIHALCRITKFMSRGYTISHRELIELAEKATGRVIPEQEKQEQLLHLISGD
jgi:hypothetical protein